MDAYLALLDSSLPSRACTSDAIFFAWAAGIVVCETVLAQGGKRKTIGNPKVQFQKSKNSRRRQK
jgi:hypothetical protein